MSVIFIIVSKRRELENVLLLGFSVYLEVQSVNLIEKALATLAKFSF